MCALNKNKYTMYVLKLHKFKSREIFPAFLFYNFVIPQENALQDRNKML